MVEVQLVEHLVAESVAFAVAQREDKGLALDDHQNQSSGPAGLGQVGIFLHELVVQFEEALVHEDLDHLVEVAGLVQQRSPGLHLFDYPVPDVLHALGTAVAIEHCKQTDQLPLAAADILLNHQSVLHPWPVARIQSSSAVVAPELEEQVADLELAVQ